MEGLWLSFDLEDWRMSLMAGPRFLSDLEDWRMSLMEGPRLLSDLEDWRMSLMEGLRLFSDLEDWRMSLMEGPRLRSCGTPQVLTRSQCRCTDLNEHIYFIIMAIKLIIIKYSIANVTVINMILIDLGGKSLINSAGFEITPCS